MKWRFLKPTPNNDWTTGELGMEFFGTYAQVFVGGLAVMMNDQGHLDLTGVALAHTFVLSFMIWAGSPCGGAHYNGAVTLACMITRNIGWKKGLLYLLSQFIGSLMSGLQLGMQLKMYQKDPLVFKNLTGYPHCNLEEFGIGACIITEFFFTFLLVFMVYATAIDMTPVMDKKESVRNKYKRPVNAVWALCIGGTLGMAVLAIGPITGAALNPWRVIGPAMISTELFAGHYWYAFVYYLICPLAGCAMGGSAYIFFMQDDLSPLEEDQVSQSDENESLVGDDIVDIHPQAGNVNLPPQAGNAGN